MLLILRICYVLLFFLPALVYAEKITLNFRETDIQEIINIISEVTQKTFVVDPRVKAKVTVVSSEPMDADQVYEVFLSILSVHGFTIVSSGAVVKIIPDNYAKSENGPVFSDNETLKTDALVTQVVRVKHVSAPQLIPLLRPLIRQQGHLVAYPANNTIIISDSANNIRRLLNIIRRVDQPKDDEIEVIILEHASAVEVVRVLANLVSKKNKDTTTNLVADERSNSVLISGDGETRLRLRTLITHLDTPIKSVGHTQVVYLRYAQATDLVKILKGVSESMEGNDKGKTATIAMVKTDIQADESTNSLIITASPKVQQNLAAVIRQLDVRRAQVLVEAVIAEVSNDMARNLGVQWAFYDTRCSS